MKKYVKAVLKSVGVVTVLYAIYNTMVHLWISMSRIARQIRLHKDEFENRGYIKTAYYVNKAVIEEAEEEWRLFKYECL